MFKTIIPSMFVLAALLILLLSSTTTTDIQELIQLAQDYESEGKTDEAEALYKQVIANYPGTEQALQAQKSLVILYIKTDKDDQAQAAFDKLYANYASHPEFPRAVCMIADNYRWIDNNHEKARDLYEIAVVSGPHPDAIWSWMGLAISNINLSDYDAAEIAFEELSANYTDHLDFPRAVCMIADAYRWSGINKKAHDMYEIAVAAGPHPDAIWSWMGLAISNINLADYDAAEAAFEGLSANYADHPDFPRAICMIADAYRWSGINKKAHDVYKIAVAAGPHPDAIWSWMGLAISNINLADCNTANQLTEKILTDFAGDYRVSNAVRLIADAYCKASNYEKALVLYQHILEFWPGSEQALLSKAGIVGIDIALGNEAAAMEAIDNIVADFADHPALPEALCQAAEAYYSEAFRYENEGLDERAEEYLRLATSVWERIVREFPKLDQNIEAQTYFLSGECYARLKEYEKAIECFKQLVTKWPDREYAWHAQFMIADCLHELAKSGRISKADAALQIQYNCQKLLDYYPNCAAVNPARNLMEHYRQITK
jgi:tetratricopeptide (TPR) repeat protein